MLLHLKIKYPNQSQGTIRHQIVGTSYPAILGIDSRLRPQLLSFAEAHHEAGKETHIW
jgi:hypothetical protein